MIEADRAPSNRPPDCHEPVGGFAVLWNENSATAVAAAPGELLMARDQHFAAYLRALPGSRKAAGPVGRLGKSALIRGLWAARSADIEAAVLAAGQDGDVVRIKGSMGSRMGSIVSALTHRSRQAARPVRPKEVLTGALQL